MISNFRLVLNVVVLLLGDSPVSEFHIPTFRNTVSFIFIVGVSRKILPIYAAFEDGTGRVFPNVGI